MSTEAKNMAVELSAELSSTIDRQIDDVRLQTKSSMSNFVKHSLREPGRYPAQFDVYLAYISHLETTEVAGC